MVPIRYMNHICGSCGQEFVTSRKESKYCSRACSAKSRAGQFKPGTSGYWTGKHRSAETSEKQRQKMLGRIPWNKGKKVSDETKEKMRLAHLGQKPWNVGVPMDDCTKIMLSLQRKGKPLVANQKENHPNWKGDNIGYWAAHKWLQRNHKKEKCDCCGGTKRLEFANKSGEYLRDISDYHILCTKCHRQYDRCGSCSWHGTPLVPIVTSSRFLS